MSAVPPRRAGDAPAGVPSPSPSALPLVIGTAHPGTVIAFAARAPSDRIADVIEARLDLVAEGDGEALARTLAASRELEHSGSPVLATIRLVRDGGRWKEDSARRALFDRALEVASWIDVEIESPLAPEVIARARTLGRTVVVSHHDMNQTPELGTLEALVDRASSLAADFIKIATRVATVADHERLFDLLRRRRAQPLALVAMGPLGASLRAYLPCVGSRLTYGYLDQPVASGQLSAAELVRRLGEDCPGYAEQRQARGRGT